jgi:signal transduction histidine kinase
LTTRLKAWNDVVFADEVHFTNVLFNIIENAIKYSGEEAFITISTQNENQKLWISVEDKGKGIPAKEIKKIFDKFYRISQGNTHNVKGFGLGLYYVHQIIKAHKWKIFVESIENEGTTFKISIPQK